MNLNISAYSYRLDPLVPKFSDEGPRTVMDAHCSVCARGAVWIARNDKHAVFKIIPLQSSLGEALMRHYGLDPDDPLSWLYLEDGIAFTSMDAVIRVAVKLGGGWHAIRILRILPRRVQDAIYGLLARNRYRFGQKTMICNLQDPAVKERLLE